MILLDKFWAKLSQTQGRQAKKIFYRSKNQQTEALKSALEIRIGKFSSGSIIIPGAGGFVSQNLYCCYYEYAP